MAERIESLAQVCDILAANGYEAILHDDSVGVKVGGHENPFSAVVTIDADKREMNFACKVAKLGDFPESNLPNALLALLAANAGVCPFAFAVVTDSRHPDEDEPEEWPVVLIDGMPIEDLCEAELLAEMEDLLTALVVGSKALKVGLGVA